MANQVSERSHLDYSCFVENDRELQSIFAAQKDLQANIESLKSSTDTLISSVAESRGVAKAELDNSRVFESSILKKKQKIEQLENSLKTVEESAKKLKTRAINGLSSLLSTLRLPVPKMLENTNEKEQQSLSSTLEGLKTKLSTLENNKAVSLKKAEENEVAANDNEKTSTQNQVLITEKEEELKALEEKAEVRKQELQEKCKQLAELQEKLAAIDTELRTIQEDKCHLTFEIKESLESMDESEKISEGTIIELEEEIERLEAQLVCEEEELKQLREKKQQDLEDADIAKKLQEELNSGSNATSPEEKPQNSFSEVSGAITDRLSQLSSTLSNALEETKKAYFSRTQ